MKLLHTSDWHLGMLLRSGRTYYEDQKYAIDKICDIAREEKIEGILLAGDVFDKSIASQEGLQLYNEAITYICTALGIKVYLIAGNHDGAERISQCSELLKKSGLYIAGSLSSDVNVINEGNVDIYLLPWISTDRVKSVYPEDAENINSMEDAYQVVLDKYREKFVAGHKNILVAHAFIVNAETSVSDRSAEVGRATMVGSHVFSGFDYVALGHLHGPQDIGDNIRYSGSLMAYSFGKEEKQVKSVTVIDTDDMSRKIIPIPQLYRRKTLKGTYDELKKADYDKDILDGYVRLEVTDSYVGLEAASALREIYINLLEISGKSLEKDDAKITMTIDELENAENDPETVFYRYCRDMLESEPTDHLKSLFKDALKKYEKEVTEA